METPLLRGHLGAFDAYHI